MRFPLRRTPRDMPCIELVELVTDYLDGALAPRERRAFEHHLTECDGCSSYLAQMRETRRLTGELKVADVPGEGVESLMAAFRAYHGDHADEV